jgi:hypothetical protein
MEYFHRAGAFAIDSAHRDFVAASLKNVRLAAVFVHQNFAFETNFVIVIPVPLPNFDVVAGGREANFIAP